MKMNDSFVGAVLLVLGLLVLWHVSSFPPSPGQPYNAALFPGIAAAGLVVAAILLIVSGRRQSKDSRQGPIVDESAADTELDRLSRVGEVEVLQTAKVPSRPLAMMVTAGSIVFYIAAANFLGFIITGALILTALMWSFGVNFRWSLPIGIIATLVIHAAFYKLLSVPLPWGLLQPFAW